MPQKWPDKHLI